MRASDDVKRDVFVFELFQFFGHNLKCVQRRQGSIEKISGEEDEIDLLLDAVIDSCKEDFGRKISHLLLSPGAKMGIC